MRSVARGRRGLDVRRHVLQLRQRSQPLLEDAAPSGPARCCSPSCSVYWYCVLLGRPPTWMSWRTCMNSVIAVDLRQLRLAAARRSGRPMPCRSLERLQVDHHPALADASGSARSSSRRCRRRDRPSTIWPSAWIRSAMAAKEMSGAASATPMIRPVSSCGKKPFGVITRSSRSSRPRVASVTPSVSALMPQHPVAARVRSAARTASNARSEQPIERGRARRDALMPQDQPGAQHRRHGQRDDPGHHNRGADGHGEFAEQAADDAAHQQHRDEDGDQRDRHRDDGEPHLARALEGRFQRRLARLDVTDDVLDHHDRVVDDEADRDGEPHQRQVVEAVAEQIHDAEGRDQRQRDREARDHGRPDIAQEQRRSPARRAPTVSISVNCTSCTDALMVCVRSPDDVHVRRWAAATRVKRRQASP